MNIKIMYHSKTGNTAKLARAVAESLNIAAEEIDNDFSSFTSPVNLLFIGDGIYAGKPDKKTISFIEKLNSDTVKNAAVFATYGGMAKIGDDIKKLLQDKGIQIFPEPFTCKGKAWFFLNRKHPDETDLAKVREWAKKAAAQING